MSGPLMAKFQNDLQEANLNRQEVIDEIISILNSDPTALRKMVLALIGNNLSIQEDSQLLFIYSVLTHPN